MKKVIQVVLVEDRPADAELVVNELERAGYDLQWVRAETEQQYREMLSPSVDVVLADYSLPQFDAMHALHLLQERGLDIPFIVVTGAYEERGVECMREGAADCLVKDRLARLGEAVRQALADRDARRLQRHAQQALRESEERYRALVENSPDGIFVNQEGKLVFVNAGMVRLIGAKSAGELIDRDVFSFVHTDYHDVVKERIRLLGTHEQAVPLMEEKFVCLDGRTVDVEVAASNCTFMGRPAIQVVARDITERKQADQRLKQYADRMEVVCHEVTEANEELRRKHAELDEFTFVASHELQEPLRKMTSFSTLLAKDVGTELSAAARQDLEFITDAARRMQTLVQDLLNLSRAGRAAMKREPVALHACVDRALLALSVRVEETGARIERDELPRVVGDPTLLTQLYQNLLCNALKFMPSGRQPRVRLTCEERQGEVILGVQDNGIGIKPEYCEQVFAPFKRLHARGEFEGSGIGLTISRKAVERHGGRIWVESSPGQGSHFRFTLSQSLESKTWDVTTKNPPSSSSRRMIPAIRS